MKKLSPNSGGGLLTPVAENNHGDLSLGSKPDPGRRIWKTAVLIEDREIAGSHILPGESLTKARINGEHRLLGQSHAIFQRTMIGKLAHVRGYKDSHIARRRIDLAGSWPFESSSFHARR